MATSAALPAFRPTPISGPRETNVARPVVFGPPNRELFGFYHAPSGPAVRATGVVLCNPLGYEAMCVHRTYRYLAEGLAAHGFAALRFDYHGTGDSAGHPAEPDRVRAWLDSIGTAVQELRDRAQVTSVALVGLRFGATLAAVAAAERGDISDLILWAPSCSGRSYVRELRAFRLLKEREPRKPRIDGDEEVAGYLFDRATVSDISALDLFAPPKRIASRALLVRRDDFSREEEQLAKHLAGTGVDVTLQTQPGYATMMRDAQESICPFAAIDAFVDWMEEGSEIAGPVAPADRTRSTVLTTVTRSGHIVREQAVQFGDAERLFGIVTEPTEHPIVKGSPAVLLLNVGANHRVGANRMYVSIARDLASRGYAVFRFDVAGLGDSRQPAGAPENRLYSKDSVEDVKAAMDFLGRARLVQRFVLLGLCSGAYLAFHTAVEDSRVVGQVLLNPQTFEWKEGDSLELSARKSFLSTRYYVSALLEPAVWARAVRGQINLSGIAGVLRDRFVARTRVRVDSLRAKIRGRAAPQSDIERAFVHLSDRGVQSLLVFSFNDGGLDMIEKHLGRNVHRMAGRKNFRFAIVRGADHTFTPIGSQLALHDIVTRYVTESFR